MDGIHDLGGRQGFGPVEVTDDDEQFHEPWEARVRGIVNAMSRPDDWNIDWFRHCRELIEPTDYLSRPYFDQWIQAYSAMMVNSGIATVEEIASGHASSPAPELAPPMSAADVPGATPSAATFDREIDREPRFAPGDAVRTASHGVSGHTRLPGYARGRQGSIHACHGAHILPDASAHGDHRAEPLYTVEFAAAELWPESAGSEDRVFIDLWESYLDDA